MITRDQALELLHSKMQSQNLRRHCYAVEAVMRALAKHLGEDEEKWAIVGLLHDGDYEFTKTDPKNHAKLMVQWVKDLGETDAELLTGIESHGWFHEGKLPQTKMQWALYCCDELTGLIVAVALVRPDPPSHEASDGQAKNSKLHQVTVDNVLSKWNSKSFAAGVKREQIEMCEEKLGITLPEFIGIALSAMQGISEELGL